MDWAVLLMAYGGPDSLEDIEPYLLDVRGGRETPQALVEEIRERYAHIGGRSPLLEITRAQGAALENVLNRQAAGEETFKVFVGMRHWRPYIQEAVQEIIAAGYEQLVTLCMTPFASRMSTGAYAEKLQTALTEADPQGKIQVRSIDSWYDDPRFLSALRELLWDGLAKFPAEQRESVPVLFTAHSLPVAIIQQGDPYDAQFKYTAEQVARQGGLRDGKWMVGYQSAGAKNGRWLGPTLEEMLEGLVKAGEVNALVAPIGFVSDHVEILYDIDVEAKALAESLGIHLERIEAPNTFPPFIDALAQVVYSALREEDIA